MLEFIFLVTYCIPTKRSITTQPKSYLQAYPRIRRPVHVRFAKSLELKRGMQQILKSGFFAVMQSLLKLAKKSLTCGFQSAGFKSATTPSLSKKTPDKFANMKFKLTKTAKRRKLQKALQFWNSISLFLQHRPGKIFLVQSAKSQFVFFCERP